jgi:hypothetical protein
MPLFNDNEPVVIIPPVVEPNEPIIVDTASNYSTEQTYINFVPFVDGTPQTTDYYNILVGMNNVIGNSNDINDPTIKQYLEILNFELRIIDVVTGEVNPETNTATITGSANIYPVITPISGDLFVTVLEEGVQGIFEITTVERYTYYKQSAWKINFTLREYVVDGTLETLKTFVTSTKYFDIKRLTSGANALITESEQIRFEDKEILLRSVVNDYYLKYYDPNQQTLFVPYESPIRIAYDYHIVAFFNNIVQESWIFDGQKPKEYKLNTGELSRPYRTIFDAILAQNEAMLNSCVKQMTIYHVDQFRAAFMRAGIFSNLFNTFYWPVLEDRMPQITATLKEGDLFPYVVGEHFYETSNIAKPLFDILTMKLIRREAISFLQVKTAYLEILQLTEMEQFYKLPVIICLLVVSR